MYFVDTNVISEGRSRVTYCSNARPDNHLEVSSIWRYSEVFVPEATPNQQPNEETGMPLYGGIDLHAHNSVVVLLDDQDHVVSQKR